MLNQICKNTFELVVVAIQRHFSAVQEYKIALEFMQKLGMQCS